MQFKCTSSSHERVEKINGYSYDNLSYNYEIILIFPPLYHWSCSWLPTDQDSNTFWSIWVTLSLLHWSSPGRLKLWGWRPATLPSTRIHSVKQCLELIELTLPLTTSLILLLVPTQLAWGCVCALDYTALLPKALDKELEIVKQIQ